MKRRPFDFLFQVFVLAMVICCLLVAWYGYKIVGQLGVSVKVFLRQSTAGLWAQIAQLSIDVQLILLFILLYTAWLLYDSRRLGIIGLLINSVGVLIGSMSGNALSQSSLPLLGVSQRPESAELLKMFLVATVFPTAILAHQGVFWQKIMTAYSRGRLIPSYIGAKVQGLIFTFVLSVLVGAGAFLGGWPGVVVGTVLACVIVYASHDTRYFFHYGVTWLRPGLLPSGLRDSWKRRVALDLNHLGSFLLSRARCKEAEEIYQSMLTLIEGMRCLDGEAAACNGIATAKWFHGETTQAEEKFERSLHICAELQGEIPAGKPIPLYLIELESANLRRLGKLSTSQGDFSEASDRLMRRLAAAQELLHRAPSEEHQYQVASAYQDLAELRSEQRDRAAAERYFKISRQILQELRKSNKRDVGTDMAIIDYGLWELHRGDETESAYLQQSLTTSAGVLTDDEKGWGIQRIVIQCRRATLLRALSQQREGEERRELLREAQHLCESALARLKVYKRQERIAQALVEQGLIQYELGHCQDAIESLRESLGVNEEVDSFGIALDALSALGAAYWSLRKQTEAATHYEQAVEHFKIKFHEEVRTEREKILFAQRGQDLYRRLVLVLMCDDTPPREKVFEYVERARSRAFVSLLSLSRVEVLSSALPEEAHILVERIDGQLEELRELEKAQRGVEEAASELIRSWNSLQERPGKPAPSLLPRSRGRQLMAVSDADKEIEHLDFYRRLYNQRRTKVETRLAELYSQLESLGPECAEYVALRRGSDLNYRDIQCCLTSSMPRLSIDLQTRSSLPNDGPFA